jgi:RimJ/RimL family protein N-acetyltransferase
MPDRLPAGVVELDRWGPDMIDDVLAAVVASFHDLHRWMPWAATMPTREALLAVLEAGEAAFEADDEWQYVMREPHAHPVVGCVGLHRRSGGWFEVGYWVRSDRTGRGFATAAAGAVTDAAFTYLPDAERVEIHMDRANGPSAGVPPKLDYHQAREEDRPILAPGHSGRGLVWVAERTGWHGAARHVD